MNGTFFKNSNLYEESGEKKIEYSILNDNLSKKVKVYILNNEEKFFSGIIEEYTNNKLFISDPTTGNWFLIPDKFIHYIEFEEKINL